MRSFTFNEELEHATSVVDLSRRLGKVCMRNGAELQAGLGSPVHKLLSDAITARVANSDLATWTEVVRRPAQLEKRLDNELVGLLAQADPHYPLDCLAVLRGLCRGVLPSIYEVTEETVPLDEGIPVPFASRPLVGRFELTPRQATIGRSGLLGGYGHRLFEYSAEEEVRVVLDFAERARLDRLTWSDGERLPRVATIHPEGCGRIRVATKVEGEFFDASPERWDLEAVLALLERVVDIEIAVLPELSLPHPGALEAALSEDPARYPPLVVAGSAHMREQTRAGVELRANEAQIYLDGRLIARHRKCHPYTATRLEGKQLPAPLCEAITREQKTITVLSGEHTRLAVVICADLIDEYIPQKLIAAGVNTLIVPSFTPKKGSFNGAIADLASRRQGIAVIANAPPADATSPFHGMVAVPRPDPEEQSRTFPTHSDPAPTQIAVFDPNEELARAISWR
jgi:hypothetical protein